MLVLYNHLQTYLWGPALFINTVIAISKHHKPGEGAERKQLAAENRKPEWTFSKLSAAIYSACTNPY